jgi:hypothetical protein
VGQRNPPIPNTKRAQATLRPVQSNLHNKVRSDEAVGLTSQVVDKSC